MVEIVKIEYDNIITNKGMQPIKRYYLKYPWYSINDIKQAIIKHDKLYVDYIKNIKIELYDGMRVAVLYY